MSSFEFSPDYRFYLIKNSASPANPVVPSSNKVETWSLNSLVTCQALLVTQTGVGQLTAVFADPGAYIRRNVKPHAMNVVRLHLKNRFGQWGGAWTGYVDEVRHTFDPAQGDMVEIKATSPYKLWEITRLTPDQTQGIAITYAVGITGSAMISYSAKSVGFPTTWPSLQMDPTADAAAFTWGAIGSSVWTDPDQQTWSALIQALIADSGTEFFFNEMGQAIYRPIGFLRTPFAISGSGLPPRPVLEQEVFHSDLGESDQSVVTKVEVRFTNIPTHYMGNTGEATAPFWQAPPGMISHLRPRSVVVYAPWISTAPAAQYLADVLGKQYASGVLAGTVTIPADPAFGIGTVAQIPTLTPGQSAGYYYVSSVTYQLDWGGEWVMTLGLTYGRASNQQFPYVGNVAYPVLTKQDQQGLPSNTQVTSLQTDPNNTSKILDSFKVVVDPTLRSTPDTVKISSVVAGAKVWLADSTTGQPVGSHPGGGWYTVEAGDPGQDSRTLKISANPTHSKYAVATVSQEAVAPDTSTGTSTPDTGGTTSSNTAPTTQIASRGTGFSNTGVATRSTIKSLPGTYLAIKAFNLALTFADPVGVSHYINDGTHSTGQVGYYGDKNRTFDCSGLVTWCYAQCGFSWNGQVHYDALGGITWFQNAIGQYKMLPAHGARIITVDQAQPGDLIFCADPGGNANSITHVAFCAQAGGMASGLFFGANNHSEGDVFYGICAGAISAFHGENSTPFDLALDMSHVTTRS